MANDTTKFVAHLRSELERWIGLDLITPETAERLLALYSPEGELASSCDTRPAAVSDTVEAGYTAPGVNPSQPQTDPSSLLATNAVIAELEAVLEKAKGVHDQVIEEEVAYLASLEQDVTERRAGREAEKSLQAAIPVAAKSGHVDRAVTAAVSDLVRVGGPSADAPLHTTQAEIVERDSGWNRWLRRFINQKTLWLTGGLLVLAGSVYFLSIVLGSLGSVAVPAVGALAFHCYAGGFFGAGYFLHKRQAPTTGHLLFAFALGLLPLGNLAVGSFVAKLVVLGSLPAVSLALVSVCLALLAQVWAVSTMSGLTHRGAVAPTVRLWLGLAILTQSISTVAVLAPVAVFSLPFVGLGVIALVLLRLDRARIGTRDGIYFVLAAAFWPMALLVVRSALEPAVPWYAYLPSVSILLWITVVMDHRIRISRSRPARLWAFNLVCYWGVVGVLGLAVGTLFAAGWTTVWPRVVVLVCAGVGAVLLSQAAWRYGRRLFTYLALGSALIAYYFVPAPFNELILAIKAALGDALGYAAKPIPVAFYALTLLPFIVITQALAVRVRARRPDLTEDLVRVGVVLVGLLLFTTTTTIPADFRPLLWSWPLYGLGLALLGQLLGRRWMGHAAQLVVAGWAFALTAHLSLAYAFPAGAFCLSLLALTAAVLQAQNGSPRWRTAWISYAGLSLLTLMSPELGTGFTAATFGVLSVTLAISGATERSPVLRLAAGFLLFVGLIVEVPISDLLAVGAPRLLVICSVALVVATGLRRRTHDLRWLGCLLFFCALGGTTVAGVGVLVGNVFAAAGGLLVLLALTLLAVRLPTRIASAWLLAAASLGVAWLVLGAHWPLAAFAVALAFLTAHYGGLKSRLRARGWVFLPVAWTLVVVSTWGLVNIPDLTVWHSALIATGAPLLPLTVSAIFEGHPRLRSLFLQSALLGLQGAAVVAFFTFDLPISATVALPLAVSFALVSLSWGIGLFGGLPSGRSARTLAAWGAVDTMLGAGMLALLSAHLVPLGWVPNATTLVMAFAVVLAAVWSLLALRGRLQGILLRVPLWIALSGGLAAALHTTVRLLDVTSLLAAVFGLTAICWALGRKGIRQLSFVPALVLSLLSIAAGTWAVRSWEGPMVLLGLITVLALFEPLRRCRTGVAATAQRVALTAVISVTVPVLMGWGLTRVLPGAYYLSTYATLLAGASLLTAALLWVLPEPDRRVFVRAAMLHIRLAIAAAAASVTVAPDPNAIFTALVLLVVGLLVLFSDARRREQASTVRLGLVAAMVVGVGMMRVGDQLVGDAAVAAVACLGGPLAFAARHAARRLGRFAHRVADEPLLVYPLAAALSAMVLGPGPRAVVWIWLAFHYVAAARFGQRRLAFGLALILANIGLLSTWDTLGWRHEFLYVLPVSISLLATLQIYAHEVGDEMRRKLRAFVVVATYSFALVVPLSRAGPIEAIVVIPLLCVLGVVAGIIWRVRMYAMAGVGFLAGHLLLHALRHGVEDAALGAIFLTALGLILVAAMVVFNLERERVLRRYSRILRELRAWD